MKNLLIICLICGYTSVTAQTILLGENAYVSFLHRDTLNTELYNMYTFSKVKEHKVKVEKIQYIYNKQSKGLVITKSSKIVYDDEVPEDISTFTFQSDDFLVKAYKKPTHCFLVLRNKVYTHFGYVLR